MTRKLKPVNDNFQTKIGNKFESTSRTLLAFKQNACIFAKFFIFNFPNSDFISKFLKWFPTQWQFITIVWKEFGEWVSLGDIPRTVPRSASVCMAWCHTIVQCIPWCWDTAFPRRSIFVRGWENITLWSWFRIKKILAIETTRTFQERQGSYWTLAKKALKKSTQGKKSTF